MDKDKHNDLPTEEERQYLVAVMVLSTPNKTGKVWRQVIRETWKKGFEAVNSSAVIKFVLGTAGLSKSQLSSLKSEQASHNDLLLLGSLKDDYQHRTLKVLKMLQWADNHLHFSYLLKCTEGTYIRLEAIISDLDARKSKQSVYWGYFLGRVAPSKTEHNWFLCDTYLPYAMGGGYIISSSLVHIIVRNSAEMILYNNDDATVGVWLAPYKMERKHDVRFNLHGKSRGCSNKHIVSGELSMAEIKSKYELLLRSGGKQHCKVEHLLTYGYQYDWTVLPSQCCKKQSPENI